jgi:hypothetical protein
VQLPPDCKLKLASKPSHVKGMQAMCEEDRPAVDPSAEWLSRQDLRNDWVMTPFMARCIIRSWSCTWAATPNGRPRPRIVTAATIWEHDPVTAPERVPGAGG